MKCGKIWAVFTICTVTGAALSQQPVIPYVIPDVITDVIPYVIQEPPSSVGLSFGAFNALYSGATGTAGTGIRWPSAWNENDIYAGLDVGIADNWQLRLAYTTFTSPSLKSFSRRKDAGVSVTYDDAGLWNEFLPSFTGLRPSATLALELREEPDGGLDKGVYFQLGINPGYEFKLAGDHPVIASVPITLGYGSDYYDLASSRENPFGYLDIGLALTTQLSLVPKDYGSWAVTASVGCMFLGDGPESRHGGDDIEVMASITFGIDF